MTVVFIKAVVLNIAPHRVPGTPTNLIDVSLINSPACFPARLSRFGFDLYPDQYRPIATSECTGIRSREDDTNGYGYNYQSVEESHWFLPPVCLNKLVCKGELLHLRPVPKCKYWSECGEWPISRQVFFKETSAGYRSIRRKPCKIGHRKPDVGYQGYSGPLGGEAGWSVWWSSPVLVDGSERSV